MHSTNSTNAFIAVAPDCKASKGTVPPDRAGGKTIANLEYEMIVGAPYGHTSDDVKFMVHARRNRIPAKDFEAERAKFFSKGQPCFRASPLTKTYGWGVHSDAESKIAIYGVESARYRELAGDTSLDQTVAMRNSRS